MWPHRRGRPVLVTTISVSRRADDGREGRGPGVAPAVGDDDRRAAQQVARGEVGHVRAFEYSAPALVELAGRPPRDRRFLRVGFQVVVGLGRRGWRGLAPGRRRAPSRGTRR